MTGALGAVLWTLIFSLEVVSGLLRHLAEILEEFGEPGPGAVLKVIGVLVILWKIINWVFDITHFWHHWGLW